MAARPPRGGGDFGGRGHWGGVAHGPLARSLPSPCGVIFPNGSFLGGEKLPHAHSQLARCPRHCASAGCRLCPVSGVRLAYSRASQRSRRSRPAARPDDSRTCGVSGHLRTSASGSPSQADVSRHPRPRPWCFVLFGSTMDSIASLPAEVVLQVVTCGVLGPQDLARLLQTCRGTSPLPPA